MSHPSAERGGVSMSLGRRTADSGSQPSQSSNFYIGTAPHFLELEGGTQHTHFTEGETGALKWDLRNPKQYG